MSTGTGSKSVKSWKPDFGKIDLLALYATMYLKRIVVNKLPWKEHLNILLEEVKANIEILGKDKQVYLYPTLRDYARIYSDQWSIKEYGLEVGQPTFHTLLLVLALRLGMQKLWVPDSFYFREDIFIDGFLSQKPKLKLTYLSQGEPLYDHLVPLCPNLYHVSMPLSDNALFMKTVALKNLRILEFSTGVADKVLCNSLWNLDKKSEKVLQIAIKEKKEGNFVTLALPHLEVLRSNIHKKENGGGSMKVTLGAAALALQPKLRLVENRTFWSNLQAITTLLEMMEKYKVKQDRGLAVDQLVFNRYDTEKAGYPQQISHVLNICPSVKDIKFKHCSPGLNKILQPLKKLKRFDKIEKLTLDVALLTETHLLNLIHNLGRNIKDLTLKISLSLIDDFQPVKNVDDGEYLTHNMLPSLQTLSLVLSEKPVLPRDEDIAYASTSIIGFLSLFSHVRTLNYYNALSVPPPFVVYACIGGAMAVMQCLKHLSLNGHTMVFPSYLCRANFPLEPEEPLVKDILPELIADATFNILKSLESFEIDEVFLSPGVDRFLEILRSCNVFVKVMYRPQSLRAADPSRYLHCYDYETMYSPPI